MEKSKLIVIEGPQGVGKTNLANYLRENIKSSNLYRLSGIPDKTITGFQKNKDMYQGLITYLKTLEETGMNLIFDRTFFTEKVYASLGFKDYNFDEAYNELLEKFLKLKFDIYYIALYLENTELYIERLKRDKAEYVKFDMENSIRQQNEYLKIADDLEKENVKVLKIAMDNFDEGYAQINRTLGIK